MKFGMFIGLVLTIVLSTVLGYVGGVAAARSSRTKTVAAVNGSKISEYDLECQLQLERRRTIDRLVEQKIIGLACESKKIAVDPAEIPPPHRG